MLYRLLRAHPDVHAFQREMRFIVDPGGLFDLVSCLSDSFSTARAREAWRSFQQLVLYTLDSPDKPPYADFRFSELLGVGYPRIVDGYLTRLLWGTYQGHDVQTDTPLARHLAGRLGRGLGRRKLISTGMRNWLVEKQNTEQQVVRYFADREELMNLTGRFVEELLNAPAARQGKKTWCEKTPHNLLFADFLQELVPESLFIHVFRDPRGVAQSFARQTWSSADLRMACRTVRDLYERWFVVRAGLDPDRLIEIRLEDFAEQALEQFNVVLGRAGLSPLAELPEPVSLAKVDYWQHSVSAEALEIMNEELSGVIERMGYQSRSSGTTNFA